MSVGFRAHEMSVPVGARRVGKGFHRGYRQGHGAEVQGPIQRPSPLFTTSYHDWPKAQATLHAHPGKSAGDGTRGRSGSPLGALAFLLLLSGLLWGSTPAWAQAGDGAIRLAVLPFESRSQYSSHDWLRTGLSEVLSAHVTGAAELVVIEPDRAALALRGQDLVAPPIGDDATALRVGKTLDADVVVWGSFDKRGSVLSVQARLLPVGGGAPLESVAVQGSFEAPWPVFEQLSRGCLKALDVNLSRKQEMRLQARPARDRYALTLFGRGSNQLLGIATAVNLEGAEKNLQRALRIDPTNAVFHRTYAVLQLELGKPGRAAAALYEALKAWPEYPAALRKMALLAEADAHLDDALRSYQVLLGAEPGDVESRFKLAQLLSGQGRSSAALEETNRVVREARDRPLRMASLKLQARLRATLHDLTGMAESFRELLEVDPTDRESRLGLGSYLMRNNQLPEAKAEFKTLADQSPDDPLPQHFLGELALLAGDLAEAAESFRAEGVLRSTQPSAWSYVGEVHRRAGALAREVDAEGMAGVRAPGNPVYQNNLAVARFREGDLFTAANSLKKALTLTPGWPLLHYNLASVLLAQGQNEKALEVLRVALALNPGFAPAHYQLGVLLARKSKWEEAVLAFDRSLTLDPRLAAAAFNRAGGLEALGRKQEAASALERYLELAPDAGDIEAVRRRIQSLQS